MIVLASASPRRKELLSFITTDFKIVPADIDETVENNVPLEKRPEYLAVKKALHISKNGYEKNIVIGCDTGVFVDGKMLGKPKNREDAENMLKLLRQTAQGYHGLLYRQKRCCKIIFQCNACRIF